MSRSGWSEGDPPQGVAILGSTGSIGVTALRIMERQERRFKPVALTANTNRSLLAEQAHRWRPSFVGLVSKSAASARSPNAAAAGETSTDSRVEFEAHSAPVPCDFPGGPECLVEAATRDDAAIVINAVVGAAGLPATLAALRSGKRVALANKESLVMAGEIVMRAANSPGAMLVPVDSEHSAIMQCLAGRDLADIRRLVITASGGPFRSWSTERIAGATLEDALNHPTWSMGGKITIDSASLANKALEVIEAHHLFGVPFDRIEVVVHPQSIVHSFVEFIDGSVLAQLGVPSMELPILCALTWPERAQDDGVPTFDPVSIGSLDFEAVRKNDFPMLTIGINAGRAGGAAPAVFNAANESAVELFRARRIAFNEIPLLVEGCLSSLSSLQGDDLDAILAADASARDYVNAAVGGNTRSRASDITASAR